MESQTLIIHVENEENSSLRHNKQAYTVPKAPRCIMLFEQGIKSHKTYETYKLNLDQFLKWVNKDHQSLLILSDNELQELLEEYLFHLKKKLNPNSIGPHLAAIDKFLATNDREYRKKYKEFSEKMEPLETQMIKLEDKIRDLEQDSNVRHVCIKSETEFFSCFTQVKTSNGNFESICGSGQVENNLGQCIPLTDIPASKSTPKWLKTIFKWYDQGLLSEEELLQVIKWLIVNKILAT